MKQHSLQIHQSDSFFEQSLSQGYKTRRITHDRILSIIEDLPHGILQIAQKFEKSGVRSGIERARDRMVALMSLYLEDVTRRDIPKAIDLINEKSVLELSRGGSDMIKALGKLMYESDPEYSSLEEKTQAAYDMFRMHDPDNNKSLASRYHEQVNQYKKSIQEGVFLRRLQTLTGREGEIIDIFLSVITGRVITTEIYENYEKGIYDTMKWDDILDKLRKEFPGIHEEFSTLDCMESVKVSFDQMKHNEIQVGEISEEVATYSEWNSLFPENTFHTTSQYITAVLTGGIEGKMKKSLTNKEFISLLEKARKQKFSLDSLESYIKDAVPPNFDLLRTITNRMDTNWNGILSKKSRIIQKTYEVQFLKHDINIIGE